MTRKVREKLYFPRHLREWEKAKAEYSTDSLKILGHPVMEAWETGYMEELARVACSRKGRVLEVGYGMGIASQAIQTHNVEEHIIIESNAEVYQHLLQFKKEATKPVVAIQDFWQNIIGKFESESFDGILFDTYPLSPSELHANHFPFFNAAHRLLKSNGIFTYYSDEAHEFSQIHIKNLQEAGFSKIHHKVCEVSPPVKCLYWQKNQLLVPIIIK